MKKVLIVGTGGHAQMIEGHCRTSLNQEIEVVGWLEAADYLGPDILMDKPVYRQTPEQLSELLDAGLQHFFFGIGMTRSTPGRYTIYHTLCKAGLKPLTYIHPDASISPLASIGSGCFVGPRAVIQPFAQIGEACIINTGAIVEHHCLVSPNTHVGPGAILCGQVTIGKHCMIGAGAVIIQLLHLEANVTVGAGSVIIKPVPDNVTIVGKPGQPLVRPETTETG